MELSMYAFFSLVHKHEGAAAAVRLAKDCGFSAVEVLDGAKPGSHPRFPTPRDAEEMRRLLDQNRMRCACYSVSTNILADDVGEGRDLSAVEAIKRCADRARVLGSPYLHHTLTIGYVPPAGVEDSLEAILPALVDRAAKVAAYCNDLGLTVLYEPQGYYVNGLDGFPLFYGEMKRRGYDVGVCGDFGNTMYAGCDPVDFFKRYASEIRHVHFKDLRMEDETLNRERSAADRKWDRTRDGRYITETLLGDGAVDMDACVEELRRVGYGGAYSLETFYRDTSTVSLEDRLRRDIAFLRSRYPND